jgi:hypothetical protein
MTDPYTTNLFSYGTLQLESVQMASFGRLLHGRRDAMPHYRKDMIEITDPDVIRTSGAQFHPVVSPSDDPASVRLLQKSAAPASGRPHVLWNTIARKCSPLRSKAPPSEGHPQRDSPRSWRACRSADPMPADRP